MIITDHLTLRPTEDGTPVTATLRYDSTIPYEVTMSFYDGDVPVTYVIDRRTLVDGLDKAQTGHHVLIGPHQSDRLRTVLVFTPEQGGTPFGMYASRRGLWSFIARTLAAVPFGTETRHLDLDAVVARLLGAAS